MDGHEGETSGENGDGQAEEEPSIAFDFDAEQRQMTEDRASRDADG